MKVCQTIFQSGCAILQFHQQCMSSDSFTTFPTLVTIHLFYKNHFSDCYLIVVLIHISLMTISSLMWTIFASVYWEFVYILYRNVYPNFWPLIIGLYVFSLLSCKSPLNNMNISTLWDIQFTLCFHYYVGYVSFSWVFIN